MPASWPSRPEPFPRLYAILDVDAAAARGFAPLPLLESWLGAGVRLIQLRAKRLTAGPFLELADRVVSMARVAGAIVVINDRVDVARMAGAGGVHVGQDDLTAVVARSLLGPEAIVGVSTHTDAQVDLAATAPVSYLAIGPVFATTTKERPDPVVGLEGVGRARIRTRAAGLPLVAIGGITLENAGSVIEAGADTVAVIGDLLSGNPGARAGAFVRALEAR